MSDRRFCRCSTFAYKYDNTSFTGVVRALDGTDADGIQVRITVDPMTIQPNVTDTTLTVTGGGYALGGLVEGIYNVEVFDSVTATGDSIWAFFGMQSPQSVELEGNADNDIVNFTATRMDTEILGTVINDRDADNNTIDPNEALGGVDINLYRTIVDPDSLVGTSTTDANGTLRIHDAPRRDLRPGGGRQQRADRCDRAPHDLGCWWWLPTRRS